MAQRLNIAGNRSVPTIDANRQAHFQQFQQLGHIPKQYKSWDAVEEKFLSLTVQEGLSDAEAAKRMGIDYKNVIQSGILKLEVSKTTGKVRGLNMRSLREDIKPDERAYITEKFGPGFLEDFQRLRELEWGDKKPKKGEDVEALKSRIYDAMDGAEYERSPNDPDFESAKTQADRSRDRLANAFGKKGQSSQVHRGHGVSALEGAGVGASNLVDEWGPLNVGHGSAPRFDKRVMRALNMSAGDLQALYDGYLKNRGLDINPVRYSGNYVAADESLRELSSGGQEITVPVESTRVSQDSIEWRDRRLFEMEQQIAAEYEREGFSNKDAKAIARSKLQELSYSQSTLFDTTQTTGGDVTVTPGKPTRKVTVQPTGLIKTDEFGRPLSKSKPSKPFTVIQPNPIANSYKAANGLTSPTDKPTPSAKPTSKAPPTQATKPAVKPKPTAPKPTSKPRSRLPVSARPATTPSSSKPTAMNPGSASQQIRKLQNSVGDVLRIHPGEWLPSNLPGI